MYKRTDEHALRGSRQNTLPSLDNYWTLKSTRFRELQYTTPDTKLPRKLGIRLTIWSFAALLLIPGVRARALNNNADLKVCKDCDGDQSTPLVER